MPYTRINTNTNQDFNLNKRKPQRNQDRTRINEKIRAKEVRLIGEDGGQVGVLSIKEALEYAYSRDLDLVEISPQAKPPVAKALNYSKYKFQQKQKEKLAKKNQVIVQVKEIKVRPHIGLHDYETKLKHALTFLANGDKVKVTVMFARRDHPELGGKLLDRLLVDIGENAKVDQPRNHQGRNMTMIISPTKEALKLKDKSLEAPDEVDVLETETETETTAEVQETATN